MKLRLLTVLTLGTALTLTAADESPLKTTKDKVSYTLGMNLGRELERNSIDLDYDLYIKGVKDAVAKKPLLTEDDARQIMMTFQQELRTKQMEKQKVMGEKAKKEGEDFLAKNKAKEGVKVTASGLQYKVLTEGKGKKPLPTDTVITHYRGTLTDGTEFDSSYKRGEPASFGVTQVIKGWTEALQMMTVGSKWQLVIPSDIAYGERGGGAKIPPHSVLQFDIELIGIKDPEAPGASPTGPTITPTPAIKATPAPKPAPAK